MSGPEHVGSGGFRVDARRALELLGRRRLAAPSDFLVCLLRAAVASGAGLVELSRAEKTLRLRFDKPMPRSWSLAPFDCLLGGRAGDAERELSQGLLAASSIEGAAIRAVSAGSWTEIDSRLGVTTGSGASGSPATEVSIGGLSASRLADRLRRLSGECGLMRCRLVIDGRDCPEVPDEAFAAPCAAGGIKGVAAIGDPHARRGELRIYRYGVAAYAAPFETAVPYDLHLRDDALKLDLSLKPVFPDGRLQNIQEDFARCLRVLAGAAARAYSPALLRVLKSELPRARRIVSRGWLKGIHAFGVRKLATWVPSAEYEGLVLEAQEWLLECVAKLLSTHSKDRSDPDLRTLWETPLWLTITGKPVTLLEISRAAAAGVLRWEYNAFPWCPPAEDALWLPCRRDVRAIARHHPVFFPAHLRELGFERHQLRKGR